MTYLPDVNLWIALTVADHVHHTPAVNWFDAVSSDSIAFCRVTQMGFLRLLTNDRVMAEDVFTAQRAWQLIDHIRQDHRIVFTTEPLEIELSWRTLTNAFKTGASFWTDSYLAAFVQATGHTLVTFDRGFSKHKRVSMQILGSRSN
jgi:toxin-antitoxin system PIN domain toxin